MTRFHSFSTKMQHNVNRHAFVKAISKKRFWHGIKAYPTETRRYTGGCRGFSGRINAEFGTKDLFEMPMKKLLSTKLLKTFIGCIAKHLFVFTPKVSHYHAFDSRRPNQLDDLT
jgi:hypothetical protein